MIARRGDPKACVKYGVAFCMRLSTAMETADPRLEKELASGFRRHSSRRKLVNASSRADVFTTVASWRRSERLLPSLQETQGLLSEENTSSSYLILSFCPAPHRRDKRGRYARYAGEKETPERCLSSYSTLSSFHRAGGLCIIRTRYSIFFSKSTSRPALRQE